MLKLTEGHVAYIIEQTTECRMVLIEITELDFLFIWKIMLDFLSFLECDQVLLNDRVFTHKFVDF